MKKLILLLPLLAGCASNNVVYYYSKPDITPEQYRMDIAQCENEALINSRQADIQADTAGQAIMLGMMANSAEQQREQLIIMTCMEAKGYAVTESNMPPPVKAGTR